VGLEGLAAMSYLTLPNVEGELKFHNVKQQVAFFNDSASYDILGLKCQYIFLIISTVSAFKAAIVGLSKVIRSKLSG
jgi:hypothetical protein